MHFALTTRTVAHTLELESTPNLEVQMKLHRWGLAVLVLALLVPANAQFRETYRGLLTRQLNSGKLPGPRHLQDYVSDGKLRLSLKDAIRLTVENNSDIRIQEAPVENAKFTLLRAYSPFDPTFQNSTNVNRISLPGYSLIQGAGTFGSLSHSNQIQYTQSFHTGTQLLIQLNANRNSTTSEFNFINPYYESFLNLQFTQPLLRNLWGFGNLAPLVIE